ncbi:MAG: amidohydrolase [Oscillospiraceae bacterium]|nr:amidohydrolase [Oscillospiraceae bacterium]
MDQIEQKICARIDAHRDEIIAFADDLWNHAELGFQEHRTAGKFAAVMKSLGLRTEEHLAVTGVKSYLKAHADGPTVCLMGEFDGLPIPANAHANPETGAAHCCGHHAQTAGVMGAAIALSDPEIAAALQGNVVFFGVPAEEYVEIELRNQMREQGLIRYGCGKCELLRIGAMDDIDITVGHHAVSGKKYLVANRSCNGFVTKMIRFEGRAAHAAGEPQRGVDAMNAAALAIHAVDLQRETFRDQDTIRVHGMVTKGADASNVIADDVRMTYSVRGKTIAAYMDAAKKVDRSMRAGAVAMGCGVTITTLPGNLPIVPVKDASVVDSALHEICGDTPVTCTGPDFHSTSSGDYGDISCMIPLLQFNSGGFSGVFHSPDVDVADPYDAYVIPAKVFALIAYKLLRNGGDRARAIMDSFEAVLTRQQYLELMESQLTQERIAPQMLPVLDD